MAVILFLIALLHFYHVPTEAQNFRGFPVESIVDQSVQIPPSPCPQNFQYQYGSSGWSGLIAVPPPNTDVSLRNNIPIKLEVRLRVSGLLPSKYVGKLELVESKNTVLQKVLQGDSSKGPILYRLHFPTTSSLPLLILITLNGKSICTGNPNAIPSRGRIITSIALEHTFYPSANALNAETLYNTNDYRGGSNFNGGNFGNTFGEVNGGNTFKTPETYIFDIPSVNTFKVGQGDTSNNGFQSFPTQAPERRPPVRRPAVSPTTPAPYMSNFEAQFLQGQDSMCGKPLLGNQLVAKGEKTRRGEWPWLVALYRKLPDAYGVKYTCGGTLISAEYVITAAHCVFGENRILEADRMLLYLGKFNLNSWTEPGVQPMDVKEIYTHPDYRGSKNDADLAVLHLNQKAEYTQYVQPACLWPFHTDGSSRKNYADLKPLVGKRGTVMGWGKDELGNIVSHEPKMVRVPVVSQEECLTSHKGLVHFTSNRTMCAGTRDGSGPCNGDSGGGLMFAVSDPETGDSRWFLRGIVSLSLADVDRMCDLKNYVVYTDVAKFGDWISQFIRFDDLGVRSFLNSRDGKDLDGEGAHTDPHWDPIPFDSF